MDLIKFNDYTPPSPDSYTVSFSSFNGAEEDMEDGGQYIEQVIGQKPQIAVGWTNIKESDVIDILTAVKPAIISCSYFLGGMKTVNAKCDDPKLSLKLVHGGTRYYSLELTVKGWC